MAVAYPIPDWLKAPSPEAIGQLALGGARLAQQERGMQMEAAQAAQRIGLERARLAEAAKENQLRAQIASEKAMRDALMQQTRAQVQAAYNDQRLSNEGKRLEQAQQRIEASAMQVAQKAALGQQASMEFQELSKRRASGELDDAGYEQAREAVMLKYGSLGISPASGVSSAMTRQQKRVEPEIKTFTTPSGQTVEALTNPQTGSAQIIKDKPDPSATVRNRLLVSDMNRMEKQLQELRADLKSKRSAWSTANAIAENKRSESEKERIREYQSVAAEVRQLEEAIAKLRNPTAQPAVAPAPSPSTESNVRRVIIDGGQLKFQ